MKSVETSKLGRKPITKEIFMSRLSSDQLDRYDYSEVSLVTGSTLAKIYCKVCNKFFYATASNHLRGNGCMACGVKSRADKRRGNLSSYIERFNAKWDYKYTYEKSIYLGADHKLEITCGEHGYFWQTPTNHLSYNGCSGCIKERGGNRLKSKEDFIERAKLIQPNSDFSLIEYKGNREQVIIGCTIHNIYYNQTPNGFLANKRGCRKCNNSGTSNAEQLLVDFVKSLGVELIVNTKSIIHPLELDIIIPTKKIAIEYDGLYYHSEARKVDRNYHLNKTILCKEKGYRLIHIFEDEWIFKRSIVESRLRHLLGLTNNDNLPISELSIVKLNSEETTNFLTNTHLQGTDGNHTYSYGLLDKEELVACMAFCPERLRKSTDVELLRFSSKFAIQGVFEKLLSAFVKDTNFTGSIISFSDKRWSTGKTYVLNGFNLEYTTEPYYDYVNNKSERFSQQHFAEHKLPTILHKFDSNLTEVENCKNNGYYRIWNCGMDKWVLKV